MDRPPTRVRERVRVELRLPPHVAQMIYDRAQHWDVSLSEAGSRLIQIGHDVVGHVIPQGLLSRNSPGVGLVLVLPVGAGVV